MLSSQLVKMMMMMIWMYAGHKKEKICLQILHLLTGEHQSIIVDGSQ